MCSRCGTEKPGCCCCSGKSRTTLWGKSDLLDKLIPIMDAASLTGSKLKTEAAETTATAAATAMQTTFTLSIDQVCVCV